ncbi:MAG: hypothetical protein NVSMB3_01940 [Acidobacteriaceae bacterium]
MKVGRRMVRGRTAAPELLLGGISGVWLPLLTDEIPCSLAAAAATSGGSVGAPGEWPGVSMGAAGRFAATQYRGLRTCGSGAAAWYSCAMVFSSRAAEAGRDPE